MENQEFISHIEIDSGTVLMELKNQTSGLVVAAMSGALAKRDGSDSYLFDIDKLDTNTPQSTSQLIIDFIDEVQKTSDGRFVIEIQMNTGVSESQYSNLALFLKDLNYIDSFVILGNRVDGTRRLILVCEGS